ncbi:MAG: MlaD family protein [Bacteroidota bacterium]|jgi:phospholipid/cholesterol/gamma-HCH transport system substrate-binding protein
MKETINNIKLGIFVIAGTILFIVALYLVGTKKNIFGSNIKIKAKFKNVNGLMEGNNVRFGGIDIGSIEKINLASDSNVLVEMWIEKSAGKFIRKNYIASVGTDGLMGNRLINIHAETIKAETISNGDELLTINPLETEEMLKAFNSTGINMKSITENLNAITFKLRENNALWEILSKKEIGIKIEDFINLINITASKAEHIVSRIEDYSEKINDEKSFISKLSGEEYSKKLTVMLDDLHSLEDSAKLIMTEVHQVTRKLNKGQGTIPKLLNDTSTLNEMNSAFAQIKKSAKVLEEDLEGLKYSFPLKRFFRKKIKISSKENH